MNTYKQGPLLLVSVFLVTSAPGLLHAEILSADRRVDWQAGIPGGIPSRTTICSTINAATYGDGVTDATSAIKSALSACPAGQVVYIPAGTYVLSGELAVAGKGVVIRGAGPKMTKLKNIATGGDVISFTGSATATVANLLSGYAKGSTSITVDDATSFAAGDYIIVDQLNNPSLVTVDSGCTWCGRGGTPRTLSQVVQVEAKSGDTLTLTRPLYYTFSSVYSPQIVKLSNNSPVNAGIEDLYIERTAASSGDSIQFVRAIHSWVKNVESYNAYSHHVQLATTYGCEIRDSYFHHARTYNLGGYGVRFCTGGSDNLIENNILYYLRHHIIFGGGGSGNVIGYNYSARAFDSNYPATDWLMGDVLTHGAHPYMNLIEGNVMAKMLQDNVWGSASHNTYFRNHVERKSQGETETVVNSLVAVHLYEDNYYNNVIGNVLCAPGCGGEYEVYPISLNTDRRIYSLGLGANTGSPSDTKVSSTLYRHGNFDYVTNSTTWDPANSDHALPASLYLSTKPAFFGNLPWPPIGPDQDPLVGTIPAAARFAGQIYPYGPGDATAPTVTAFVVPTPASSLTVSITSLTATDDIGVAGYFVSESAAAPSPSAAGWSASAPTGYAFAFGGSKTLYAFAKDAAGNVSAVKSATVDVNADASCVMITVSTWQSSGFAPQTGIFAAEFDAVPNADNMDGVIGLSQGAASAFASLAAIVRFNSSGFIDARDGSAYAASAAVAYTAGASFHFRLRGNVAARTYTIYVRPFGGSETVLGEDYAFRTEQSAVTALDHWSLYSGTDGHTVCAFTVNAVTPAAPTGLRVE